MLAEQMLDGLHGKVCLPLLHHGFLCCVKLCTHGAELCCLISPYQQVRIEG